MRSVEERLEDKKEVGWMLGLTSFFLCVSGVNSNVSSEREIKDIGY